MSFKTMWEINFILVSFLKCKTDLFKFCLINSRTLSECVKEYLSETFEEIVLLCLVSFFNQIDTPYFDNPL